MVNSDEIDLDGNVNILQTDIVNRFWISRGRMNQMSNGILKHPLNQQGDVGRFLLTAVRWNTKRMC
jgi:hypothetical protein